MAMADAGRPYAQAHLEDKLGLQCELLDYAQQPILETRAVKAYLVIFFLLHLAHMYIGAQVHGCMAAHAHVHP